MPKANYYASSIVSYLTAHPRRKILVSNMLDDLGIYTDNPATGRRSYTVANQTLRGLVRGQRHLKYKVAGIGDDPLEGLEVVGDVPIGRGNNPNSVSWHKCTLRYTPPVKDLAVIAAPVPESHSHEVHVHRETVVDLSGLEQHLSERLAEIHSTLLAVLDEQKTANTYLRHLVESWEPGYTADNKENQQ